jgi:hypothetical protein
MVARILRPFSTALRGVLTAVRTRRRLFIAVALGVFLLDILVPPLVLSLARKPVDFFTFNPWLKRLPDYLAAPQPTLTEKLGRLWDISLFWFSADGIFGVEWGFAVTVGDLARFGALALMVATYFALWAHRRETAGPSPTLRRVGRSGGVLGALSGVLGLSTSACTVMGCGAPVIPVVGLAFVGLSSTTLKWMADLSFVGTSVVLGALILGVALLGWRVGAAARPAAR